MAGHRKDEGNAMVEVGEALNYDFCKDHHILVTSLFYLFNVSVCGREHGIKRSQGLRSRGWSYVSAALPHLISALMAKVPKESKRAEVKSSGLNRILSLSCYYYSEGDSLLTLGEVSFFLFPCSPMVN